MLNDWCWEKFDESEYRLKDAYGQMVAYLICNYDDRWFCRFWNDEHDMKFCATFEGLKSAEEVIWQATLWIYNTCNQIANSFHHIRDHLPSLHELGSKYYERERSISNCPQ